MPSKSEGRTMNETAAIGEFGEIRTQFRWQFRRPLGRQTAVQSFRFQSLPARLKGGFQVNGRCRSGSRPARPVPRPWFPGGAWTSGKPECPAAPTSGSNSAPVPLSSCLPVPRLARLPFWQVPAFHPLPDGRPSWFSEPVKQFTNVSVSAQMRLTSNSTS